MNLVLLGGMNPETQPAWIAAVEAEVKDSFDQTAILQYEHWQAGGEMRLDEEHKRLVELVKDWDDYMVVAKSAGTWVLLRAVYTDLIKPQKCVFVGTAVNPARESGLSIDNWLDGFSVPSVFVQQTNDRMIGSLELGALLDARGVKNKEIVEVPGGDHQYSDIADLGNIIRYFAER